VHPNEWCVHLSGDLDMDTADAAFDVVDAAIRAANGLVVKVDLGAVTFADSSALTMLLNAQRRADADGVELVLRNVPKQMCRTLEITKLDGHFKIDDAQQTTPTPRLSRPD
jgi:anti-sigma B factor antagonist